MPGELVSTTQTNLSSTPAAPQSTQTASAVSSAVAQDGNPNPAPTRPEGLPDQYWDATANAVKLPDLVKDFGPLATLKAEHDARMAAVPAKSDDYKLDLAKDYKLPDGVKWEWDEKNPLLAQAREFAKASGLSQDQFSALTTMFVSAKVGDKLAMDKMMSEGDAAEKLKLGANATVRIDAAKTALTARVGKDRTELFFDRPIVASDLELIEDLLKGSGGGFTQQHRETQAAPVQTMEDRWYPRKAS